MRHLLRCLIVVSAIALPFTAHGQSYPSKPIRIIVPFPPGNTMDIMTRLIAPKIAERLGHQVVVDNRAGAAGQLGLDLAARAAPDGYTLVGGQGGNLVVQPHTYKKLPYDPIKDFAPIAIGATNYLALVVHPSVPFKTVKGLIDYAKANPGKLSFASNGEGGFPHMTIEMLRLQAGFSYLHVPYKGTGQIAGELIGGHVDAAIDGFTGMSPHIKSGKVRLLGITNPTRVANLPDVPAIAETVPGYDSRGWFGWLAPAKTPREIVMRLNQEINRAMELPDVKEKLVAFGLIVQNEPPEFFAQTIKSDYEKYGALIKKIGLQPK